MHWEEHVFDLPGLPKNMKWYVLFDTAEEMGTVSSLSADKKTVDKEPEEKELVLSNSQKECKVKERSIVVLIGK